MNSVAADCLPDPASDIHADPPHEVWKAAREKEGLCSCDPCWFAFVRAGAAPVSAAVSPAELPEENESERMLLMALGRLVGWGVVRYEENMGGGWFSASEIGTAPVRADEVRELYAREREARDGR